MPSRQDRRSCCLAALTALTIAACGGGDEDAPAAGSTAATPAPVATAAPTATPAPLPASRPVRFRASDGKPLRGRFTPAGGDGAAVVLVHELDGGPDQWDDFIPALHAAGIATLAYASRGNQLADERLLARDVAGAVRALGRQRGVDPGRLGVIGASIGATATSWFAGGPGAKRVAAFVALSPVPFQEVATSAWRPHDLLILTDEEERVNADAMVEPVRTGFEIEETPLLGHGVALLPDLRVRERVLEWLAAHLA